MGPDEQAPEYWKEGCGFLRVSGFKTSPGTYLIHNKAKRDLRIGLGSRASIDVYTDGLRHRCENTERSIDCRPADAFGQINELLDCDAPAFFVVSPDIERSHFDANLPLVRFTQPEIEIRFSPDCLDGEVSYARSESLRQRASIMLSSSLELRGISAERQRPGLVLSFGQIAEGWRPLEADSSFLGRLDSAIAALQQHPDGKLTLTRSYQRTIDTALDPFELYQIHAGPNGNYACSHFFCLDHSTFSVGCTPENVFEIEDGVLSVDVVAGTWPVRADVMDTGQKLLNSPKQVKEHLSSLNSRAAKYQPHCASEITVERRLEPKLLRNVAHLHSTLRGRLRSEVSMFDLLDEMLPLLGARPSELRAIADSEEAPHRYYGGVFGYSHGSTSGCFLNLRNALIVDDLVHAKVGVGIIAESERHDELEETRHKISGLMEAIFLWRQGSPV